MSPPAAAATSAIAAANAPLTEHAVMNAIAAAGLLPGRLDDTIHSVLLGGGVPVPHRLPSAITINMAFDPGSVQLMDTRPFWVADGMATVDLPDDVVDALERIALTVLHSDDVRDMVVDYVDENGAHDNDQLGTVNVALGLAQSPDVGLPYVARIEL